MPIFSGHGTYHITVIDHIIVAKLIGQWNDITTEKYLTELKQAVESINLQPWILLADMSEWEFVEFTGYNLGRDFNDREFDRYHQTHEIWITSNKTVVKMLSKVTQLPEQVIFQHYFNVETALRAMQQEISLSVEALTKLKTAFKF